VVGWVKGEAFYQGRPTSYWKSNVLAHVRQWESSKRSAPAGTFETLMDSIWQGQPSQDLAVLANDPTAVPVLTQFLNDSDPYIRMLGIEVLDFLGPSAREAVPSLMECLNDEDELVRDMAAFALHDIDPQGAIDAGVRLPRRPDDGSTKAKVSPDPLVV